MCGPEMAVSWKIMIRSGTAAAGLSLSLCPISAIASGPGLGSLPRITP